MSVWLTEQAPAKINLTLRIVGRRADGYHELESLVAFADLADTLTYDAGGAPGLKVTGAFADACGPAADNLVLKAAAGLAERIKGITLGAFILEKRIPVAAGLGGGSADAAAALRLIARANDIALDDSRLLAAARAAGADVPVCFDPKPRVMRGIGEMLSAALELPKLPALLVNPGLALPTKAVFAAFEPAQQGEKSLGEVPRDRDALVGFLGQHRNDLTRAAAACQPVIAEVLEALAKLPGCRIARMSGAGATCFALFQSAGEVEAAARKLQASGKSWWLHAAVIG